MDDHDDFDAVLLGFAEDADIGNISGGVEVADVFFDDLLGVRATDAGAHIGENFLLTDGACAGVLDFDGADDGGAGGDGGGERRELTEERGGVGESEAKDETGRNKGAKIHR